MDSLDLVDGWLTDAFIYPHDELTDREAEALRGALAPWIEWMRRPGFRPAKIDTDNAGPDVCRNCGTEQPAAAWAPRLDSSTDAIAAGIAQPATPPTVSDWVTAASATFPTARMRPKTRLSITDFQRVVAYMMEIGATR